MTESNAPEPDALTDEELERELYPEGPPDLEVPPPEPAPDQQPYELPG